MKNDKIYYLNWKKIWKTVESICKVHEETEGFLSLKEERKIIRFVVEVELGKHVAAWR